MKIKLQFNFFTLTYNSPIQVRKNLLLENNALEVEIFCKDVSVSKLQLSSLPYFHNYNLSEWKYVLFDFFNERDFDFSAIDLELPYFNTTKASPQSFGELQFIIESVLFSVIEKLYPDFLNTIERMPIRLNALYSPVLSLKDIPDCLKIKIRPLKENLLDVIRVMRDFKEKNSSIRFRLDGNGSFEYCDLANFLNQLSLELGPLEKYIEYIEEPFKNFHDHFIFKRNFSFPIAMDESLLFYKEKLDLVPNDFFLIVKPSLLGISTSFQLLKAFKQKVIISSCYESESTIRSLLYLASINPATFHGLDTFKFLPKELGMEMNNFCLQI